MSFERKSAVIRGSESIRRLYYMRSIIIMYNNIEAFETSLMRKGR